MKKSPLQNVKDTFGSKEKLVKEVEALAKGDLWIDRVNPDKGLSLASNKQLLNLHEVLTAVKSEFGSRSAMVDAIVEKEGRAKDADYKSHFEGWSTPRLWDRYSVLKRNGGLNPRGNKKTN